MSLGSNNASQAQPKTRRTKQASAVRLQMLLPYRIYQCTTKPLSDSLALLAYLDLSCSHTVFTLGFRTDSPEQIVDPERGV